MTSGFDVLPSHWELSRLDHVATVNARIGWKALTAAEYQPEGYAFLATPNIKTADIDFKNVNYISEFRYEESPELKLQKNDVLLVKDGNTLGIVNIIKDLPRPATVNGSIAVLRANRINAPFFRFVLDSAVIQEHIEVVKDGMGVPHLFQRDIRKFPIPLPPQDEQQRIADFLDAETSRIDHIAALERNVSQKLTERENAFRDSVVDGLEYANGALPFRRFLRGIEQGASPQCDSHPKELPTDWGVLKLSAVKSGTFNPEENKLLSDSPEEYSYNEVREGDLLVTRANTPSLVGDAAVVSGDHPRLLLPDLIYRILLDSQLLPEYACQVILSNRTRSLIEATARGSSQSMVKLRGEDIRAWPIPVAPQSQQSELVSKIATSSSAIRQVQSRIATQLDLLAERRQALITAAVTGQFDVSTASGRGVSVR